MKGGEWLRERLSALVLFLATALAFVVCYLIAQPFLPALAWALALALIAHPVYDWMAIRWGRKNLAAALAVALVAVAIVAPAIFITRQIVGAAAEGLESVRTESATGRWRKAIESNPRLGPAVSWIKTKFDLNSVADRLRSYLAERGSSLMKNSAWTIAEVLVAFFFLFYFFRDGTAVVRSLRSLIPLSETETDDVFKRVTNTIYATVYGTLAVAVIQGVLGGLMFWWLGVPSPMLWGTAMALLAIVPVLGAFVIWLPAALFLALEGNWGQGLILAIWGSVVVSLIDNLLYPVLVGQRLKMHTVPVFVSIVGGLALFGASGLILGPVVLAVTAALVDVWRRRLSSEPNQA